MSATILDLSRHIRRHWPRKAQRRWRGIAQRLVWRRMGEGDMKGFPEVRVYDPTQLIECEVGGVWHEFERVQSATDAELARVLLGVLTLEGDGKWWVACSREEHMLGAAKSTRERMEEWPNERGPGRGYRR